MFRILHGDALFCLKTMRQDVVNCVVTSPPYWGLRDYGVPGAIGSELDDRSYVANLVAIFSEIQRVLRPDGTVWLNLGDCYAGSGKGGNPGHSAHVKQRSNAGSLSVRGRNQITSAPSKNLLGIPWRVAFALQDAGWYLRSEIIWAKPNGMPGSQRDRCTSSHETIFMLTKSANYWSDFDAIKTPSREATLVRVAQDVQSRAGLVDKQRGHSRQHAGFNARREAMEKSGQQARPAMMRDVWFVSPGGYRGAHFAVMPEEIARRCVLAGCPEGGIVLDPFGGAGTTAVAAERLGRHAVLFEMNAAYIDLATARLNAL